MNYFTHAFFTTKSKLTFKLFAILALFVLNSQVIFGQTTVTLGGLLGGTCPFNPTATWTTPPAGLTFSNVTRGAGVTCGSAGGSISGSAFNNTLAAGITASKWYTFTITSDASTTFTLNSLSIKAQVSSATGSPNYSVQYSIGAGARTAIGSFTPTTSSVAYAITPGAAISVPVSSVLNIFIIPNTLTAAGTTARFTNASTVNVTASAAASATITPSPTTLSGLTYIEGSGPSTASSFAIAASDLTSGGGTITIAESTDYEVSTTSPGTSGFGASATLSYTGTGALANNTVWVRLKAGRTAGNYNSQTIAISGGTASSSVTVSGSVIAAAAPSITGAATATAFTTTYGTASTEQSFAVSGVNLTTDLVATAPTGYEVSNDGLTYGSTATFTHTAGSASGTLRIRLTALTNVVGTSYNSQNIVLSSTGATSVNITTAASGNVVSAKALGITGTSIASKVYNASAVSGSITPGTVTGLVGTQTLNVNATGLYADANAGIGKTATITYALTNGTNGGVATNYSLAGTATGDITVAPLTITANNVSKFGGVALTSGAGSTAFSSSGLQSSETIGTVTITYGAAGAATGDGNTAGVYASQATPSAATAGTFTASNYSISYVAGTITVTVAPLAAWQFGSPAALGSEATYGATTNDTNLNTSTLSRGAGVTATALGRAFSANAWRDATSTKANAKTDNEYYQFTVNAKAGYTVSLSKLDASLRRTSTGPNAYIWTYSTNGSTFNEIGTDVSFTSTVDGVPQSQIDLSAISALQDVPSSTTITFRLYAWGGTSATATFAIGRYGTGVTTNSLAIAGTVTASGTPLISFSPATITTLSSTNPTAGTALTTTISGSNLTTSTGDITVTAPTNFEVSNDGSTWGSSATFAYTGSGATFTQSTVSFRIAAGVVAGAVSGSATSAGGGVSSPPSIALSGNVISSDPTVVASGTPTKLFGNFGFASDTKTITVSGTALGVNNLTCTLAGYEFSTVATGPFTASPFAIAPTSGTVATTTVYFRLTAANTIGNYDGNIVVSSIGATPVNIAVTGTVYASGTTFTKDNIIVLVQGDGVAARTNAATPSFLNEYTPAGVAVQSVALPLSLNGTNRRLSMSGTATADGAMTLSPDGKLLVLCGYDSPIGTLAVASTAIANPSSALATNARVVATVNQAATVNSSTFVSNVSGANIRSAITLDGSRFWLSNSNGTRTIDNITADGVSTSLNSINSRILTLNGSTLTVSSASGANIGINTLGNLPTGAVAPSLISGLNSTNGLTDAYSFFYFDRDPAVTGNDLLYVANNAAGIKKFSFNGTTWSPRGTILTSGGFDCTSITGNVNISGDIDLIVTVGTGSLNATNSIKRITDTAAYNAQISNDGVNISTIGTTLATSATNTVFRAVSFAPVNNPDPTIGLTVVAPAQTTTAQNNTSTVLLETKVEPTIGNAILSGVSFVTNGTYVAGDIANFKLYLSTDATFDSGDTLLSTVNSVGVAGETINFSGLASAINKDITRYLLVVATVATCGTISNTFGIGFTDDTNFTFVVGNKNISPLVGITGNTNSIIDSGQVNVTLPTATSTITKTVAISWVAPAGCYDDVMIVAAPAANTGSPTGTGSLYTANLNYTLGTILGNGRVVYKGTASPQTITSLTNGTTYYFKIFTRKGSLWSSGIEITGTPAITPALTEVLLPQFIQGVNGTNANVVPYAYRVKLSNLLPTATYRYNNSVVLTTDLASATGTGGMLFPNAGGFTRSTSQSLNTTGSYGSFTTDSSGAYTGWFITEPNATVRFTPGNNLKMRIMLNDGAGGSSIAFTLTTTSTAKVINFGTSGSNTGTAISGSSYATDKNFVMLWDNTSGAGRPISGTFVENDGTTGSSYAPFYTSTVEGVSAAWGTIIPNTLVNGVRKIQQFGLSDGIAVGYPSIDTDGIWPSGVNTVSPASGSTALVVTLEDAPLALVTQIRPMQCGKTLRWLNDNIQSSPVIGATQYRFEVIRTDDALDSRIVTSNSYLINPAQLSGGLIYGKSYNIRVQTYFGGSWKVYGPTCTVTAPSEPLVTTTKVRPFQCGATLLYMTQVVEATPVYLATTYEFEVTSGAGTFVASSPYHTFSLYYSVPGRALYGTAYSIRVRSKGDASAFTAWGDPCVVSTPIARITDSIENDNIFNVKAFPNPFASHFSLDIESSSDAQVELKVYDMIGRQLEVRKASVSELSVLEVGRNYPAGVYNLVVSQGDKVKSIRMIKR